MKIIFEKHITRHEIINNPNSLYVFGDNDARKGRGGFAKECRGCKNSIGIRVKKYPSMGKDSFYNDSEFESNIKKIDEDINKLFEILNSYDVVVFSSAPIGSGLANLPNCAPRTYKYLIDKLKCVGVVYE